MKNNFTFSIALVTLQKYPSNSATGNYIRRICHGLQLNGWAPCVISLDTLPSEDFQYDPIWNIPYLKVPILQSRNKLFFTSRARDYGTILKTALFQLLHHPSLKAIIFFEGSYTSHNELFDICNRHYMPVIPLLIESYNLRLRNFLSGSFIDNQRYFRKTLRKSSGIIGISTYWHRFATFDKLPYVTIPSYLPDETKKLTFPEQISCNKNGFHIVSIGRLVPRELPLTLFAALKKTKAMGISIRCTIIGTKGTTPAEAIAMRRFSHDVDLQSIVTIAGWVNSETKATIMNSADAFVLLRHDDKETAALFPTRLPEYLVTGRPLILSKAGDFERYLEHNKHVYFIPPGKKVEDLTNAFRFLSENADIAKQIGKGGFNKALETFSIEYNGKLMSDFLLTILNTRINSSIQDTATNSSISK